MGNRERKYRNDVEVWAKREKLGEVVCGGFVVIGRDPDDMRLNVPMNPFEWPTQATALAEAERLASLFPSRGFFVFALTDGIVHMEAQQSNPRSG